MGTSGETITISGGRSRPDVYGAVFTWLAALKLGFVQVDCSRLCLCVVVSIHTSATHCLNYVFLYFISLCICFDDISGAVGNSAEHTQVRVWSPRRKKCLLDLEAFYSGMFHVYIVPWCLYHGTKIHKSVFITPNTRNPSQDNYIICNCECLFLKFISNQGISQQW